MKSYGTTGQQRGPRIEQRPARLDITWSDDGELIGVTLAGDPLTPNQARALRRSVLEVAGKDELPHSAIDAWEARLWAQETGANRGEPC